MKGEIYSLISELRALVEAQMEAVREDRIELLFDLQERRSKVVEKIQKIDITAEKSALFDGSEEESSREEEENSPSFKEMILEIIEMDREIKERIRSEMNGILGRLNRLEQMKKGFCQRGSGERQGRNLCLNA